jgi:hypothetical protein
MFAGPSAGTATHDKIPFFAKVQKYTNTKRKQEKTLAILQQVECHCPRLKERDAPLLANKRAHCSI